MYGILLTLHVLGATVWTGGHLVLALSILPRVLKEKDIEGLKQFESGFEKLGIPALIIQITTGLWLAYQMLPEPQLWFNLDEPVARVISLKLLLLLITAALAIDARLRIIPRLSQDNLTSLAWHIIPVTLVSVLFVIVGVSFKTGWFY